MNTIAVDPNSRELNRAAFDWCLRSARPLLSRDPEQALPWCHLAAKIGTNFDGARLTSPALEGLLLDIAARLPVPQGDDDRPPRSPLRWLHVMTEAYPIGGNTALVVRWIQFDPRADVHHVALLAQRGDLGSTLPAAVAASRGTIHQLEPSLPLTVKAERLRQLAWSHADVVALHVHPSDVVPTVAFGVPGGPAVLLVDTTDHTFWVGGSIADRVVSLRDSGATWSRRYRGIDRSLHLPIPLAPPPPLPPKADARRGLGLPDDAPVLLTVGTPNKYSRTPAFDFVQTAEELLRECPTAYVVAVGPSETPRWRAAHAATGGRLIAAGSRVDLRPYHAAADLYIEGFPLGSLTAMLEAGLQGIACVRAPRGCPPPFTSDSHSLAAWEQPADVPAYVAQITRLLRDPVEREREGARLATAIAASHLVPGWADQLAQLARDLPKSHGLYPLPPTPPLPEDLAEFWSRHIAFEHRDHPFQEFFSALDLGLDPRLDRALATPLIGHGANRWQARALMLAAPALSRLPRPRAGALLYALFMGLRDDGRLMRLLRRARGGSS